MHLANLSMLPMRAMGGKVCTSFSYIFWYWWNWEMWHTLYVWPTGPVMLLIVDVTRAFCSILQFDLRQLHLSILGSLKHFVAIGAPFVSSFTSSTCLSLKISWVHQALPQQYLACSFTQIRPVYDKSHVFFTKKCYPYILYPQIVLPFGYLT